MNPSAALRASAVGCSRAVDFPPLGFARVFFFFRFCPGVTTVLCPSAPSSSCSTSPSSVAYTVKHANTFPPPSSCASTSPSVSNPNATSNAPMNARCASFFALTSAEGFRASTRAQKRFAALRSRITDSKRERMGAGSGVRGWCVAMRRARSTMEVIVAGCVGGTPEVWRSQWSSSLEAVL